MSVLAWRPRPAVAAVLAIALALILLPAPVRATGEGIITTVVGGGVGDGGPATSAYIGDPQDAAVSATGDLYVTDSSCRVRRVSAGIITTAVGNGTCGFSGDGGPAESAMLNSPSGVAIDSAGNIYIADTFNCRIRKVSGGIVTTVAGDGSCAYGGDGGAATSGALNQPTGIAVDDGGNLFIADYLNCRVREVSGGTITTMAGTGACSYAGDGGPATSARLDGPSHVAVDGNHDLFIADSRNCRVRAVSGGTITTVAGNGHCWYGGDGGPATSASISEPWGVAVDSGGTLYVTDHGYCNVRKVSSGTITTVAGTGYCGYAGDGGPATSAILGGPAGVAVDGQDNFYIADSYNCRVREVSDGIITTVVGECLGGGDGGPATNAMLRYPDSVALDAAGNLFIADSGNCRIREVSAGIISTVAGNDDCGYGGDGSAATSTSLNRPYGVAVDGNGTLYIADSGNNRIRKVSDGTIATIAFLSDPIGIAVDAAGNLYVAEQGGCDIREISGGTITTVAGGGDCGYGGDGGPATSATLNGPTGVALDGAGNLYIADYSNCRVRKVTAGIITTVAGNGLCAYGGDGGTATSASLYGPYGVAADGAGHLYVADSLNCRIREVSGGIITTVAGSGGCGYVGDGGPASSASLWLPDGVGVDTSGALYIADTVSQRVRFIAQPCAVAFDPDCSADVDFSNPGPGQPCIQDHGGDANADGYSDSDEFTPVGTPSCTGAFPAIGGLGLTGLSSGGIDAACAGRPPGSQAAKAARADVNLDGKANLLDLSTAAAWYGQLYTQRTDAAAEADQNSDGKVNLLDLGAMAGVFGQAVPPC